MKKKQFSKYIFPSIKDARKRLTKTTEIIYYKQNKENLNGQYYHIKTYGCQGNLADSEKMRGILEQMGYLETLEIEKASIIIFNTCAIRENAENRVFGELGRIKNLKKKNENLLMIFTGCMSQEEVTVDEILKKYPQIDIIIGTHNIHLLKDYIKEALNYNFRILEVYSKEGEIIENVPTKRESNIKAWVNIMYGCCEFCTYCIVPYTRGKERSRLPQDIINEVNTLIKDGYQEITLLGQNVNAYGNDLENLNYTFKDLLEELGKMNIKRIRFTTSHPKDLDIKTIKVMSKYQNIMPHLHLPVQSGSNFILKKMNRKYTKEEYLEKINLLKTYINDISITTDIIVGFPYETEDDFNQTLDLVEKAQFEGAYTFIFSKRSGTPAYNYIDDIPDEVKKERLLILNQKINEGFKKGNLRFVNQVLEVLVEKASEKDKEYLTGYTIHNKIVNFKGDKSLIGTIVKVKIEKAFTWHLLGKLI